MNLLHISDIHFGNEERVFPLNALNDLLVEKIKELGDETYLILSGDITLKGQTVGFNEGKEFFLRLCERSGISMKNILMCPGNHDFCKDEIKSFSAFTTFAYGVRRDDEFNFSKRSFLRKIIGDVYFIFANSAYHLDHTYGYIDPKIFEFLESEKEVFEKYSHRVFVVHHHLLNQYQLDTSSIRNAYKLLYSLDKAGFDTIFHGHQHSNQTMPLGQSGINMISARSFNFEEKRGSNGVNICQLQKGVLTSNSYIILNDDDPNKLTLRRVR